MSTNGKWRGKDGQWYDTLVEKSTADAAWDEKMGLQEEQNRLLRHQNQLLEQQNQLNYQLEQEKIQKNYELEMNKMQHEEKMRLYKLFDNIGISKEIYDAYINTNFLNKENKELLDQKDEHLLMISKYDFLLHEYEKRDELGWEVVDNTMHKYDMYDLKDEIKNTCYRKVSKVEQKKKGDLIVRANKAKTWLVGSLISVPILLVIFILICEGPDSIVYAMVVIMLCVFFTIIISACIGSQTEKQLKEMPDKTFDEKKYYSKLKGLIADENNAINKLTETIRSNNKKTIDDFNNYRINHYNSNIEKLLVDVGFKELVERLGLEYMKVNNSNKNKEGIIEDYIEYFESHS